jgi:hypothetical protein
VFDYAEILGDKTMLRQRFDLITELHEEIVRFREGKGIEPKVIILSPASFEWLVAIFEEDKRVLGVSPVDTDTWTYNTGIETLRIMIDELLDDYTIKVM